jgi:hypothetical protein
MYVYRENCAVQLWTGVLKRASRGKNGPAAYVGQLMRTRIVSGALS